MSGNQTQIPVIQTQDSELIQVQQNVNKVLRNLFNQITNAANSSNLIVDANGILVGTVPELNVIQGTDISVSGVFNVPLNRVDLTITSTGGSGSGTVTSVAFSDGSTAPIFSVSGSPITTSGTIIETLLTQTANTIFAGPTSGGAAQPTFRALVSADIPGIFLIRSINVISSNQTLGSTTNTDYVYVVSGTTTVTMPTAVSNTNLYTVKNGGSNTVTIIFTGGQNADGSTSLSLTPNTSLDLISDNSNYRIV